MNHWLETSKKNLLPLSKAVTFSEALREWFFTGTVIDYEEDEIACELCEHPDLSHHFAIENRETKNSLLVGSSCILKFEEIDVFDGRGVAITDPTEREHELKQALRKRVIESGLEPLRRLWTRDRANRSRIERLASSLKLDVGISPSDLFFLLKQMDALAISYQAKSYKISLGSYLENNAISLMDEASLRTILPALSKTQLAKLRKWGKDV